MTEKDKHNLVGLGMFVSAIAHIWAWGLGYHYWIEPNNVGPWLVVPLIATTALTWMLLGGAVASVIDSLGWWED